LIFEARDEAEKGNAMRILTLFLAASIALLNSAHALASDVKVIANSSVRSDSITVAELKSVFLEESRSLRDGSHAEPVLARSGGAHNAFLNQYLGKTDDALQNYYRTLVFTGKGSMPKELNSDAEVLAYVARTKGAIGYVDADSSSQGAKTLLVIDEVTRTERKLIRRVEPEYPETLKRLLIGGTVRLTISISPKGSVETAELLGGNPILGESAITAVKKWVYAANRSRTKMEVSIPFDPRH
jgi:TonB family protein